MPTRQTISYLIKVQPYYHQMCASVSCIGNDKLEQVRCTKFIGLHIDDHLEWDIHINHCKSKVSSGIYAKNVLSGNIFVFCIIVCHMVTYSGGGGGGGTLTKSILINWKFYRKKPFVAGVKLNIMNIHLRYLKLQSHHPVSEPVRCRQSKYLLPAWSPCISAGPPSSCSS